MRAGPAGRAIATAEPPEDRGAPRPRLEERVGLHPRLVEEAVREALRADRRRGAFERAREALYAIEPPEARDAAFDRLHLDWFRRLGLDRPLCRALAEQEAALAGVERGVAVPVARDQGVELFVAAGGRRSIAVALRPETLADGDRLLTLLRRELLHVADMLDPSFGYEPRLPAQPAGPAHDRLLRDRYRVLWDCSVDGRLVAAGRLDPAARAVRWAEFLRHFGGPGEDPAGERFRRLFDGPRPRHADLVAQAAATRAAGRCALCGCPTVAFEPDPAGLPEDARRAIAGDCPGWTPERGLCLQCADLYRGRAMSEEAARRLPGIDRLSRPG
jgi:hypothetical protein